MNLKKEFANWNNCLTSGHEDYSLITRRDDLWYFINKKKAEQILALQIMIDEGFGLRQEYEYSIDNPETDKLSFSAIINSDNQMIIQDENGEVAFGIFDVLPPAQTFLICCRTEKEHKIISAGQTGCQIKNIPATPWGVEDVFDQCIEEFYLGLENKF